jgi:hypothetical protein
MEFTPRTFCRHCPRAPPCPPWRRRRRHVVFKTRIGSMFVVYMFFVIDGKKKHSRFIVDGGCLDNIKVEVNT